MAEKNMIDKDRLIDVALCVDSISYILQDVDEDFFAKFNSRDKEDILSIAWEFNRNRAKINAIVLLLNKVQKVLEKNEITAF
ncbi:MAG: hypothetical protein UIM53_05290 [Acutalibacteraceae bacterium]|nr:hypothetical protein [Acutalibacteraceae bacterium]